MTTNFLMLDESSFIFRSYYAINHKDVTPENVDLESSADVYERTVRKFIKATQATYALSAQDLNNREADNFDVDGYKEGRHTPEALAQNFAMFEERTSKLGIPTVGISGNEADDVIASVVNSLVSWENWNPATMSITIASNDKDLLQLVDDDKGVRALSLTSGAIKFWTNKEVNEQYGIKRPSQLVDWKALAGDKADNYKGVNMIGPKTASKLVSHYGSIEKLYEAIETGEFILSRKNRDYLVEGRNDAYTCYKLAKLNNTLKANMRVKDMRVDLSKL